MTLCKTRGQVGRLCARCSPAVDDTDERAPAADPGQGRRRTVVALDLPHLVTIMTGSERREEDEARAAALKIGGRLEREVHIQERPTLRFSRKPTKPECHPTKTCITSSKMCFENIC